MKTMKISMLCYAHFDRRCVVSVEDVLVHVDRLFDLGCPQKVLEICF